jgi:hypothetical protein
MLSSCTSAWDPPEHGRDACEQLGHAERLRDVVVRAGLEAPELVRLLGARREHDDGDRRVERADLLADPVAVHVGEHEVEDDAARLVAAGRRDPLPTLGGREDLVSLELEGVPQAHGHVRLVLDDEDAPRWTAHEREA